MVRIASRIVVASIGILLASRAPAAQPSLTLPEIDMPTALRAYTNESRVQVTTRAVIDQLRTAKIGRHRTGLWSDGLYTDANYPKRVPSADSIRYDVERSACDEDAEAMAVHRGLAWIAVGYNLFGRVVEGLDTSGPKFVPSNTKSTQTIDLGIAGFGRAMLARTINAASLARHIQVAADQARAIPTDVRADIRAFLTTLLQLQPYYAALAAQEEPIRDLLYLTSLASPKPREAARDLVRRMNALGLASAHRVAPCLEGFVQHVVTTADGRIFESGSIYSGGIMVYSMGFWWRREREGTTPIADAALRWVINRLAN